MTTLALVESPAQLLHLLEWVHATGPEEPVAVAVLAPADQATLGQLRSMADFAEEEDLGLGWYEPRRSPLGRLAALGRLREEVGRARRLLIGDPFSGLIQATLPFARAREVVVLDDGTATMEFAAQLAAGEPLRRWHADPAAGWLRAPLARHTRTFFRRTRPALFTVMPVGRPGLRLARHGYDWTRRRFGPPRVLPGLDVVGTSLVETGVVEPEAYLQAVERLAADHGHGGRYFAHRREDPAKLQRLAERSGLRIVRPKVPLEIELRRGPVAARLASYPSSVGYTLPLVLAGTGTAIEVQPLPPAMIRPGVGVRAHRFLERVTADMLLAAAGFGGIRSQPLGVNTGTTPLKLSVQPRPWATM